MEGGRDPDCRHGFPWDTNHWDTGLLDTIKTYIRFRKTYPVLQQGDFVPLLAEDGVVAYLRCWMSDTNGSNLQADQDTPIIIVLNTKFDPITVDIPIAERFPENSQWQDLLGESETQVTRTTLGSLAIRNVSVPERSGLALALIKTS